MGETMYGHHRIKQWRHISERKLLLLAAGEATGREAKRIREHVDSCWSCRARLSRFASVIDAYVDYRDDLLSALPERPPGNWASFETRLRQIAMATECAPRRFWQFSLPVWRPAYGAIAAALLIGAGLFVRLSSVTTVSAEEVFRNIENAAALRAGQVDRPVIYQKVRLRRRKAGTAEFSTLETWNELRTGRSHHRGGGRIWSDFMEICLANRIRQQVPISDSGYRQWVAQRAAGKEIIERGRWGDSADAVTIKTSASGPYRSNDIIEASLAVRTSDWHPVQERFLVKQESSVDEFEVTESAYEILGSAKVPHGIFDLEPNQRVSALEATLAPAPVPMRPIPSGAPAVDLDVAEVELFYALHRVRACLAEQMQVSRKAELVVVYGLVDTTERKQQIVAALAEWSSLPHVSVEIETVEELLAAAPGTAKEAVDLGAAEFRLKSSIQDRVERAIASADSDHGGRKATQWMSDAVSLSEDAMSEAWALRKLAEWRQQHPNLQQTQTLWLLEAMLRDHQTQLRHKMARLRERVIQLVPSANREAAIHADAPNCSDGECLELFNNVKRINETLIAVLAGPEISAEEATKSLAGLIGTFYEVDVQIADLDRQLAAADKKTSSGPIQR